MDPFQEKFHIKDLNYESQKSSEIYKTTLSVKHY